MEHAYITPIVKSAGLENANFTLVYNGGEELSDKYTLTACIVDGVVCGRLAPKKGLVISIH
jgi:hypothetical protein